MVHCNIKWSAQNNSLDRQMTSKNSQPGLMKSSLRTLWERIWNSRWPYSLRPSRGSKYYSKTWLSSCETNCAKKHTECVHLFLTSFFQEFCYWPDFSRPTLHCSRCDGYSIRSCFFSPSPQVCGSRAHNATELESINWNSSHYLRLAAK